MLLCKFYYIMESNCDVYNVNLFRIIWNFDPRFCRSLEYSLNYINFVMENLCKGSSA